MTTTSSFMSTFTALGVWLALRTCALLMSSSFGWGVGVHTTNTVAEADIAALSPLPGAPDGPGRPSPAGPLLSSPRGAKKPSTCAGFGVGADRLEPPTPCRYGRP